MFCPNCGQKLSEQETVCPYCRADVNEMLPPPSAQTLNVPSPSAAPVSLKDAAEPEPDLNAEQEDLREEPAAEGTPTEEAEETPTEEAPAEETSAEEVPTEEAAQDAQKDMRAEAAMPEETVEAEITPEETDREAPENGSLPQDKEASEFSVPSWDELSAAALEEMETARKKKRISSLITAAVIALLLLGVFGISMAYNRVYRADRVDAEAAAITVTDADGSTVGQLNNQQLSFYYWGEYYYYINSYGFSFDASVPLDEQPYGDGLGSGAEDVPATWEAFFMNNALNTYKQAVVLSHKAETEGFTMPEDYQAEYDSVVEAMPTNAQNAGFVQEDGTGDVLAYIQDSYGPDATVEAFEEYLYTSYFVSAYSDSVFQGFTYTDSELEAYYDDNQEYFTTYGVEKSDLPNINVRHILIEPESGEDGEISDEAWEAAEKKAKEVLEEWKDGEATEESFAALANENSADGGSNTNGGLYENVAPGDMVQEFNDWCFDEKRKAGDTDIVKTQFGYHIMYFVAQTEEYAWKTKVENEKRYKDYQAWLDELMGQYEAELLKTADVADPDAVKQIQKKAAEEAAAQEAAAQQAAQEAAQQESQGSDIPESLLPDESGAAG